MLAQEGAAGVEPKPAFNISAGLTLTTQLLSLIAFFTSGIRYYEWPSRWVFFLCLLYNKFHLFKDKFHLLIRKARQLKTDSSRYDKKKFQDQELHGDN
jgi:hypothetical protein